MPQTIKGRHPGRFNDLGDRFPVQPCAGAHDGAQP